MKFAKLNPLNYTLNLWSGNSVMPAKGFTLVELLVTLIIVAVLASVAFPVSKIIYVRERESDLRYYLRRMRDGIDSYKSANPVSGMTSSIVPGDGVDNDLDGHVDEEILDGRDNDGDGLTDEDLKPSGYPRKLTDLVENQCLRTIPVEPFGSVWQYRNSFGGNWTDFLDYGSSYSAMEGDDIYDVRTSNEQLSINGESYSLW